MKIPSSFSRRGLMRSLTALGVLNGTGPAFAEGTTSIRIGGGDFLTLVAGRLGFFDRIGLSVRVVPLAGSKAVRTALATGAIDLADYGLDNALAMPDVTIVYESDRTVPELVVQPHIRRLADLAGRTLLVDARDTQNALALRRILAARDMAADRDYTLAEAGPTPQRIARMLSDPAAAGTMAAGAQLAEARSSGLRVLASAEPLTGQLPYYGGFVLRRWAETRPAALPMFIAGKIMATRWARTAPASTVIACIAELLRVTPAAARMAYDEGRGRTGWSRDCAIDRIALRNAIRLRAAITGQWNGHPPSIESLCDDRFRRAAMQLVRENYTDTKFHIDD